MPTTKAGRKAVDKYVKNNYDTLLTRVAKGRKAELQQHAAGRGESLNGFVCRAIDETVKRDNQDDPKETAMNIQKARGENASM